MILVIDHYDSFTHNLARYIMLSTKQHVEVISCDQANIAAIIQRPPQALVLSPGPGHPKQALVAQQLLTQLAGRVPILGICLGHQVIGMYFGAQIKRCQSICHGKTSRLRHQAHPLFDSLPHQFAVTRYHSWQIDATTLPSSLEIIAESAGNIVMAIAHRHQPIAGLQFHPEAYLTEHGLKLIDNFFKWVRVHKPTTRLRPCDFA